MGTIYRTISQPFDQPQVKSLQNLHGILRRRQSQQFDGGTEKKVVSIHRLHTIRDQELKACYSRHLLSPSGTDSDNTKNFGLPKGSEIDNGSKLIESLPSEVVPEAFVWYYLKQMAVTLHRMENIPLRRYMTSFVVHQ